MVKSNYMEFDLTPEITDEIIFAMEDQTGHFLYDSVECRCAESKEVRSEAPESGEEVEDRYFVIPVWDSISGFRMMDRFVSQLRNPVVREELRVALSSGHGVFRNFKNILKSHPEVERLWYQFKERSMRNIVLEWYNSLRDYWGLDRIGPEPEETGEIVSNDFTFRLYTPDDENELEILLSSVEQEVLAALPAELAGAIEELWNRIGSDDEENEHILVAENAENEIVAAVLSSPLPSDSFLSAHISAISVYPEYRGLGIGKELLSRTVEYWTGKGYRWLLATNPLIPRDFVPALQRCGFTDKGHVSVLDLSVSFYH